MCVEECAGTQRKLIVEVVVCCVPRVKNKLMLTNDPTGVWWYSSV